MGKLVEVREEGPESYAAHGEIPIGFWVESRLDTSALAEAGELLEVPIPRFYKDYDEFGDERPSNLGDRFDLRAWGLLSAFVGLDRVGGVILARYCDYATIEGRDDLAAIVDIRVKPEARQRGVGSVLFGEAVKWATARGCTELRIETQDTNVRACRFYRSLGCSVLSIDEGAYLPDLDEARIVWSLDLSARYTRQYT